MYFNKKRFKKYLASQNIDLSKSNLKTVSVLQKYINDGKTIELRNHGILSAINEEINAFLSIEDTDQIQLAIRLNNFIYYSDKFLYQITNDVLSEDEETAQESAFEALRIRSTHFKDFHAEYNLILLKYHLDKISSYQAAQQLKELEGKAKQEFEQDKAKHAKHQVRFTEMLLAGRKYIANNSPRSATRPPLFETSIGEKRRSKLALATFSILSTLTLTATIGAGLVFGGYVVLPVFLAWAAPIIFSLLVGLSAASGISILALLSESFKPQAVKHFLKASVRAIGYVFIGLAHYLNYFGMKASRMLNTKLFKPSNMTSHDSLLSEYREMLQQDTAKTIFKTLAFPLSWLLGVCIGFIISPITSIWGNYIFACEKFKANRTQQALTIIISLLTYPLSFVVAAGLNGIDIAEDDRRYARKELYEDAVADEKSIAAWEVDQLVKPYLLAEQDNNPVTIKSDSRLKQLNDILSSSKTSAAKIAEINNKLAEISPATRGKKNSDLGQYKPTRFIKTVYKGFELGIFEKPKDKGWLERVEDYTGQDKAPPPPPSL